MSQQIFEPHPLEKRILLEGITISNSWKLDVYESKINGYAAAKKAAKMQPQEIKDVVKESGLRGLGGAGFPAGVKWGFLPKDSPEPTYLVCNADEGEPGTFKDRQIMEHLPHRLIEGMICSAIAIGSETGYIYVRGELVLAIERLEEAISQAYEKGYLGKNIFGSKFNLDITVHPGAGAYICGEETGLISSLEGERGEPRLKPPFPAIKGAFGGPTIVNNVATLAHVPGILNNGAKWFIELGGGTERTAGTNVLCVSGDISKPGYYEVPIGFNLKKLLNEICGGPKSGRRIKAVFPGGSSSPVLKSDELDVAHDFDSLAKAGTMAGSGAIIVLDDSRSMPEIAMMTARFYAHESCGQCVPCREGTKWSYQLLNNIYNGKAVRSDIDKVVSACNNMAGKTICVLSDACAMPVNSIISKFKEEFYCLVKNDEEVIFSNPRVSGEPSGLLASIRKAQQSKDNG